MSMTRSDWHLEQFIILKSNLGKRIIQQSIGEKVEDNNDADDDDDQEQ